MSDDAPALLERFASLLEQEHRLLLSDARSGFPEALDELTRSKEQVLQALQRHVLPQDDGWRARVDTVNRRLQENAVLADARLSGVRRRLEELHRITHSAMGIERAEAYGPGGEMRLRGAEQLRVAV